MEVLVLFTCQSSRCRTGNQKERNRPQFHFRIFEMQEMKKEINEKSFEKICKFEF